MDEGQKHVVERETDLVWHDPPVKGLASTEKGVVV